MDQKMLPLAILLLLLLGTNEKEILDKLDERNVITKTDPNKKMTSQTYVRATTEAECIEVERMEENGEKSYKVEARLEPFIIMEPVKENIKDGELDARIQLRLKNMKIDGLNKFKIAGISKKVNEKNSDISFDLPDAIKINSEYSLSGTVGKKKLKGEGNISLRIKDANLRGNVQISDDEKELLIQDLNLWYDFKDLEISVTGLQIDDTNQNETAQFVNQLAEKYLKSNSDEIGRRLAYDIKERLNRKLKGITTSKVLSMLKIPN